MKTILYQPLFINPQAYFVFPQLYHIEKGDSYIEPANITGQLIINDLTKSLTSTPILNVVQDTNQVDFGLFKGKHIRISQYTNIGAVVLGEWYIPGTPTPPEPEQPDWFKESIVAWYSPYCKQRMTNFDVIESYVTDFTTWYTADKNYVGLTIRSSSFSISFNKVSNHVIMWKLNYLFKEEEQVKLQVSGITDNISIVIKHGTQEFPIVNGVNTFSFTQEENKSLSFVCKNVFQDTNITITQLPTSIIKDFSGNGNHAYLYGGKGKLNSGMGVYQQDFSKLIISRVDKKQDSFSFTVSGSGGSYLAYMQLGNWNNKAFKILANINAKSDYLYLRFRNSTDAVITSVMLKNGENIIPAQNIEGATKAVFEYSLKEGESITITQIPDYPDQLCYDGKMYAVCYGFPILTDYTVMAERTWFERQNRACFLSKITTSGTGAFGFEFYNEYNEDTTYSFGRVNNVEQFKDGITYQITNSYNGIVKLDYIVNGKDNAELYIGKLRPSERPAFIGCHGNILIFNRSLTEYEISWVKNNMMCSKPQEPDIDL